LHPPRRFVGDEDEIGDRRENKNEEDAKERFAWEEDHLHHDQVNHADQVDDSKHKWYLEVFRVCDVTAIITI
jgi:hypothetical protein